MVEKVKYTKMDIWNDLSELQATMFKGYEWQSEVREIMKKIEKSTRREFD
jgi:hypothetical protein